MFRGPEHRKLLPDRGDRWYEPLEAQAEHLAGRVVGKDASQPWMPAQRARIEYPRP